MQVSEALPTLPVMALRVVLDIQAAGQPVRPCAVFLAMYALLELFIAIPHGRVTETRLLTASNTS